MRNEVACPAILGLPRNLPVLIGSAMTVPAPWMQIEGDRLHVPAAAPFAVADARPWSVDSRLGFRGVR